MRIFVKPRADRRLILVVVALNPRRRLQHLNVQRHLTSAQTHRGFRAVAMDTWRTVVATA